MEQKYYVLLGDVVSSRRINDRENFQRTLEEACGKVNSTFPGSVYANFKILKGLDEIGGVLTTLSGSYEIISTVLERLHPNMMRFALVAGRVDAFAETRDVAKMDGPAFHKASDIMDTLKKSRFMFMLSAGDDVIDGAITGTVNSIILLKKNWSAKQRQIVMEYEKTKNQYKIAKGLGISQQAVSKSLKRSMQKDIKSIEEKLNYILNEYAQRQNQGCNIECSTN